MGIQFGSLIPSKEIELASFSGKKIAVDAYNNLYQYLTIIRDRMTGEPLRDRNGNVTSHLSGLFYRTSNWIEIGIKPIFVFDGPAPEFKKKTIEAREEAKKEATKKWEEALKKGKEAITYAQAAAKLTKEMVDDSKRLLDYMGIPWVQAPSEGEAQCAAMVKEKKVDFSASQDYDSLLFGSPNLIRNISITGKRKLPKKETYIEVKPELIELKKVLDTLGINHEQLITMGILIGTDYNEGVKGIGPKRALELVKNNKTLEKVLKKVQWNSDIPADEIFNFFLHAPSTGQYKLQWKEPSREKIMKFMVDEHSFSQERMENVLKKLQEVFTKGRQVTLGGWLNK